MTWPLYILLGSAGFCLCLCHDWMKLRRHRGGGLLFCLGCLAIFAATGLLLYPSLGPAFETRPALSALFSAGALASLGGLVYALFFALPVKEGYDSSRATQTVTVGLYGMCRHPGFWFFALTYLFLALLAFSRAMAVGAAVFVALELAYVFIEDRYVFPATLAGYDEYKKSTPFLIPAIKR